MYLLAMAHAHCCAVYAYTANELLIPCLWTTTIRTRHSSQSHNRSASSLARQFLRCAMAIDSSYGRYCRQSGRRWKWKLRNSFCFRLRGDGEQLLANRTMNVINAMTFARKFSGHRFQTWFCADGFRITLHGLFSHFISWLVNFFLCCCCCRSLNSRGLLISSAVLATMTNQWKRQWKAVAWAHFLLK